MKAAKAVIDYLSVGEVAAILGVSSNTVIRQFEKLPGVVDLGRQETLHKRRKRCLRIPRTVLEEFVQRHQANRPHNK
jgi:hypothetical protein